MVTITFIDFCERYLMERVSHNELYALFNKIGPLKVDKDGEIYHHSKEPVAVTHFTLKDDILDLEVLNVNIPGEGTGTTFMKQLTALADMKGYVVSITPNSVYGAKKSKLNKFYKKFGFIIGNTGTAARPPK